MQYIGTVRLFVSFSGDGAILYYFFYHFSAHKRHLLLFSLISIHIQGALFRGFLGTVQYFINSFIDILMLFPIISTYPLSFRLSLSCHFAPPVISSVCEKILPCSIRLKDSSHSSCFTGLGSE